MTCFISSSQQSHGSRYCGLACSTSGLESWKLFPKFLWSLGFACRLGFISCKYLHEFGKVKMRQRPRLAPFGNFILASKGVEMWTFSTAGLQSFSSFLGIWSRTSGNTTFQMCVFKLTSSHCAGFRGTAPLVGQFCDRESLLPQPFQQLCKYMVSCIKSLSAKTPRRILVSYTKPLLRQKLLSLSFLQKRKLNYRKINLFPPRSQSTKWQSQDLNPKAISFCYPPLNKITQDRVASRTQEGKTAFIYQPITT